jgi:chemotaxis family two-component system response regulator Rcp1
MANKLKILVVDDNIHDMNMIEEALQGGKILHELYKAFDGNQAIDLLHGNPPYKQATFPDLILLDLNLPGTSGLEVLEAIKSDPDLHRIPVVVLAASSDQEDIHRAYDLHANGYVTKPVNTDQFFEMIKGLKEFWLSVVLLPKQARK